MTYSIEFSKRAERQFNTLPQQIQKRLQLRIDALAMNPHPRGAYRVISKNHLPLLMVEIGQNYLEASLEKSLAPT